MFMIRTSTIKLVGRALARHVGLKSDLHSDLHHIAITVDQ